MLPSTETSAPDQLYKNSYLSNLADYSKTVRKYLN